MRGVLKFNKVYFAWAMAILVIEILIAKFVHDQIIRPYIGDLLVVILIYCFVKAFLNIPVLKAALGVLVFSYTIEFLQYFRIVKVLGLQKSELAKIIIGTSFAWLDLLAYTMGIVIILFIERTIHNRNLKKAI